MSIQTSDTTLSGVLYLRIKITRSQSSLTQNLDFTLTFVNPCTNATLDTSAITIAAITVRIGETHTSSPAYAVMPHNRVAADGTALSCGLRTYSILDSSDAAVSWITVSGTTTFTITATPNNDNLYNASA